jgi:hypothetical protein
MVRTLHQAESMTEGVLDVGFVMSDFGESTSEIRNPTPNITVSFLFGAILCHVPKRQRLLSLGVE